MKDINEMKTTHDKIKNHIWRTNNKGVKSYASLIKKFVYQFHDCLKEDYKESDTPIPITFFHETMSCVNNIDYLAEHISKDKMTDSITAIESSIGVIHRYINTGKFESFMTYYSGSNYDKKRGRWTEWTFHKKLNRFSLHPKYKERVIENYEKAIKNCDDEEEESAYKEELKYWKTL